MQVFFQKSRCFCIILNTIQSVSENGFMQDECVYSSFFFLPIICASNELSVTLLLPATINQLSLFNTVALKPYEIIVFFLNIKEKRHHRMPLLTYYNNELIFIIIVFVFILIFVSKDIRIIKQSYLCYLILYNVRASPSFFAFAASCAGEYLGIASFLISTGLSSPSLTESPELLSSSVLPLSLCCRLSRLPDWFESFAVAAATSFFRSSCASLCSTLYSSVALPLPLHQNHLHRFHPQSHRYGSYASLSCCACPEL